MSDIAVDVNNVSKKFRLYHERNDSLKTAILRHRRSVHEDFWALQNVTFEVPTGKTFGLIGRNGSGKSTLLKCLARILHPETGNIVSNGRQASMLEVGSGFHPELSGRENIYLNGSILGMSKREIDRKFDEILAFSGVERFIDQPVKTYSSGMYVRLGFSVAISVQPDILVVDEVLSVGDATFKRRCNGKFEDMKKEGRTVIFVSHSMAAVEKMCDEVAWLDKGQIRDAGEAKPIIKAYLDSIKE